MRTLVLAGLTMVTALAAIPADAQRLGPGSYRGVSPVARPAPIAGQQRWGGRVGGHWYGGTYAPGGWNAYRRPSRGYVLPRYWIAPTFYIGDYSRYGLSTPPQGYAWTRYYDDAVLADSYGRVWDSRSGLDWDGGGSAYAEGGAGGSASSYGYNESVSDGYGASYAEPGRGYDDTAPTYAPPPAPRESYGTTYSTGGQSAGGGYYRGGYYYPPATTTTVTIQSAPVETVTTTDYVEEATTTTSARRVYRAPVRKWRPRIRRSCGCGCCR